MVPASGGPPVDLCDGTGLGGGGSWNRNGVILFATGLGMTRALRRVNASGDGSCSVVTNPPADMGHSFPEFLPDGEHYLFLAGGDPTKRGINLASLTDPSGRRLLSDFSSAFFSRSSTSSRAGHLLFLREGTLMALPFDADTLQATGDVVPILTGASISATQPQVAASVSADGLLVYLADRRTASQPKWIDRGGKELGSEGAEGEQNGVALSPNEQFALWRRGNIGGAIWLRDLSRDSETPFSNRPGAGGPGVWSGGGLHVIESDRNGRLISRHVATGKDEELAPAGSAKFASDWSRDGQFVVYTEVHPTTQADIWVLTDPLNASNARKPAPYLATPAQESQAQLSPDGRWLAYVSNESGGLAVYVSRFPTAGEKQRISAGDGREPRWRRDGRELYYLSGTGGRFRMMAVQVEPVAEKLQIGTEAALFDARIRTFVPQANIFQYSPTANGQRFLVNVLTSDAEPTLNVISNWQSLIMPRRQ